VSQENAGSRVFDLDAYLRRLQLDGARELAAVHRAHVAAIPFENLDPHRGAPVSLELEDLQRKLVHDARGGYCFEHNLLLKAALEALGASVEEMLARVRLGADPGSIRPRTHLVLRVLDENTSWLADVGFGAGTLLEPLPFEVGAEGQCAGWRFRLCEDGDELVVRSAGADGAWLDLYGFVPQPVPHVDIETSNWFVSTHPRSPFRAGLVVCTQDAAGARTRLSDWDGLTLVRQTPAGTASEAVSRERVPQLLADEFGLPGFALDADGRVVPSAAR